MNIVMAFVDYIPVVMFLIAAIILQRDLYRSMSKGAFALFSAGTITVFVAGLFKATWKLLYALGICDFVALNKCFFPMQTVGFVLAAAGVVAMLCYRQGKGTMYSVAAAPAAFTSNMPFVVLMVLGVAALDISLCVVSKRRKATGAMLLYLVSFVFIMGMGYLSSRDFAQASMNWLAEGVNIIGQGSFLAASVLMHKKAV